MGGFSPKWLELREPLDLAARNGDVEKAFRGRLPDAPATILDLASGAGSTVAALDGFLEQRVAWHLTDHDPALLDVAAARWRSGTDKRLSVQQIDLAGDLETLPFEDADAVTTSAFLDLVSGAFLDRLVSRIAEAGKPFLASLTYDGRTEFSPAHPLDSVLVNALNEDQKSDKGFGRALGPDAAGQAVARFASAGFHVVSGPSDWRAGPDDREFLKVFLEGWYRAARARCAVPAEGEAALEDWYRMRLVQIEAGELALTVGHVDLAAWR